MLDTVSESTVNLERRHTVCSVLVLHVQLTETEVAKSNMSSVVEKDVLGLQVTVNDVETVQTLQSTQKFGCVESSTINVESLLLLQMVEKLTAVDESQDEVELLR
jgi:hypothetical protein